MKSFEELLDISVARHGHLCAGQVIGVRMAMHGCRLVGIDDPEAPQFRKKLIVYVEIDRCASDAIQSVTGCSLGRRSLKFLDFGINAATFVNLASSVAYRIVSTESSRKEAAGYAPGETDPRKQQLVGYQKMPIEALFAVSAVTVQLPDHDLPGPPRRHCPCSACGQMVRDGKEIYKDNRALCRPCAGQGYFVPVSREDLQRD